MISFLTVNPGAVEPFLDQAAPEFRARAQVVKYRDLLGRQTFDAQTYIFADVDSLRASERTSAEVMWRSLSDAQGTRRLLNNPSTVLQRQELLDRLSAEAMNDFRSFRSRDVPDDVRYPVFVRHARLHTGSLTPLLHRRAELDASLARLTLQSLLTGLDPSDLLVLEHLDTADVQGVYRKYSAFRVGDRVLPRHVLFSRTWEVKKPDLVDPELLQEERRYLDENPDEAWLVEVFRQANVGYGRIDYSFFQGRPQVWEINLNPVIVPRSISADDPRREVHDRFIKEFQSTLETIDGSPLCPSGGPIVLRSPARAPTRGQSARFARKAAKRGTKAWSRTVTRFLNALPEPVLMTVARLLHRSRPNRG